MAKPLHPDLVEHERKMGLLPCVTRCMCGWSYEGPASEGRERAAEHRAKAHPEIVPMKRRRGGHLHSFRQADLKRKDLEEIYAERDKRAFLHGIEISDEE